MVNHWQIVQHWLGMNFTKIILILLNVSTLIFSETLFQKCVNFFKRKRCLDLQLAQNGIYRAHQKGLFKIFSRSEIHATQLDPTRLTWRVECVEHCNNLYLIIYFFGNTFLGRRSRIDNWIAADFEPKYAKPKSVQDIYAAFWINITFNKYI